MGGRGRDSSGPELVQVVGCCERGGELSVAYSEWNVLIT